VEGGGLVFLEEVRVTTRNLIQDSRSSGLELNPGPPECESGVLYTLPRHTGTPIL
jgi:hypothetical protein